MAYGIPMNAFIGLPLCDRNALPTNLLPFGKVTRSSSDVRAIITQNKLHINNANTNNLHISIFKNTVLLEITMATVD